METANNIPFKCPYNEFSCDFSSSSNEDSDMTCRTCPHYQNGVKATGGMPILKSVYNLAKKIYRKFFK